MHILTDETLLFNWDAVLGCQLRYLQRYFALNSAFSLALKGKSKREEIKNFEEKSDFDQITKKASQPNNKHLLVSNNEFWSDL